MRIRPATIEDAHAIAEVHVASWATSYSGIVPEAALARWSVAAREERWSAGLANPYRKYPVLVAEGDKGIVGFASYGLARDDDLSAGAMELYAIYLLQDFQRQGWGRQLWEQVLSAAYREGAPLIAVWALEANQPARTFYERLGFMADGTKKVIPFETKPLPEVRYRLELDS